LAFNASVGDLASTDCGSVCADHRMNLSGYVCRPSKHPALLKDIFDGICCKAVVKEAGFAFPEKSLVADYR
jgi:hypothetical protein